MKKLIGILLSGMLIISCADQTVENTNSNHPVQKVTGTADVEVMNEILVFSSQKAMYNYINSKTQPALNNDFISQKDLFNNVVDAEWEWFQNKQDSLTNQPHCPLYHEKLKDGLIREVFYSDGTQSYTPNLSAPFYNKILNKEGFFAVGDTIFQITPTLIKKWIHGDINNYEFLKNQTITNEEYGIYITDNTQQEDKNTPQTRAIFPIPNLLTLSTGIYCSYGTARTTAFINDQIKIINPNSYDRTFFIQISHQILSGGVLRFVSKSYNLDFAFKFVDKKEPTIPLEPLLSNQDYTGSCDYFYIWAPLMVIPGQDAVNYTDTYYYLYFFGMFVKDRDLTIPSGYTNRFAFYGERENYTSGNMVYDFGGATTGDRDSYQWVSEMPR